MSAPFIHTWQSWHVHVRRSGLLNSAVKATSQPLLIWERAEQHENISGNKVYSHFKPLNYRVTWECCWLCEGFKLLSDPWMVWCFCSSLGRHCTISAGKCTGFLFFICCWCMHAAVWNFWVCVLVCVCICRTLPLMDGFQRFAFRATSSGIFLTNIGGDD